MPPALAVFGAGPGLGASLARRFAREGFEIVLVARRAEPLVALAGELRATGSVVHVVPGDLSDTDRVPELTERVRVLAGDPDVLYYGAAPDGFLPARTLTPRQAAALMPLAVYTPLALVQAFLPAMLDQDRATVLTAQGASAVEGRAGIAGGLALAAQRNYWQSLHTELAGTNVFVGGLYVGAVIEGSAFHARRQAAQAMGHSVPDLPVVHPDALAQLLWTMHRDRRRAEETYPDPLG